MLLEPSVRTTRQAGRRTLAAGILTLALSAGLLGSPSPAQADEVGAALAHVNALQGEVALVAGQLSAGTRRYEADRRRLVKVDQLLLGSRSKVGRAQRDADAGVRTVGQIAAQLYRSPQPGLLLLSLSHTTVDLTEVLAVQDDLQLVSGRRSGEVRKAVAARVRLQAEQRVVVELRAEAKDLAQRSAQHRRQLVALAGATSARLDAAQSALVSARAARAAAVAAQARAARADQARADQARPGRAGLAAPQAAPPRARPQQVAPPQLVQPPAAAPGCPGGSTAGQANGNLDPATLCPLWNAPGETLRGDAARAFNAMSQYKAQTTGTALCVTDSYRSYRNQVAVFSSRPGLAAVPGTSNHGWGQAVDLCGGAQSFSGAAYLWLKANAGRFGFTHPGWAEPGRGMEEPWHWEYGT